MFNVQCSCSMFNVYGSLFNIKSMFKVHSSWFIIQCSIFNDQHSRFIVQCSMFMLNVHVQCSIFMLNVQYSLSLFKFYCSMFNVHAQCTMFMVHCSILNVYFSKLKVHGSILNILSMFNIVQC